MKQADATYKNQGANTDVRLRCPQCGSKLFDSYCPICGYGVNEDI